MNWKAKTKKRLAYNFILCCKTGKLNFHSSYFNANSRLILLALGSILINSLESKTKIFVIFLWANTHFLLTGLINPFTLCTKSNVPSTSWRWYILKDWKENIKRICEGGKVENKCFLTVQDQFQVKPILYRCCNPCWWRGWSRQESGAMESRRWM